MLKHYRNAIAQSLACRKDQTNPYIPQLIQIISVLVALYICLAIFLIPPGKVREFNFVDERGAVTALSAVFFAMGSAFAFVSFLISKNEAPYIRVFWLLMTMAVGFLALDELLQFHERVGDRIDAMAISTGPVRNWNDIVVIMYGVVAAFAGLIFLPIVLRYAKLLELIAIAFVFYAIHTTIDSLVEPPTTVSVILEESAKLYCSTFIALAILSGLLSNLRLQSDAATEMTSTGI